MQPVLILGAGINGAALARELVLNGVPVWVVDTADSRNLKVGLNFFFDKNLNHLNIELAANHGQSAYGPSSVTAATAGYVPTSLDPVSATGPRRPFTNSLANPAFKSLLVHWNVLF